MPLVRPVKQTRRLTVGWATPVMNQGACSTPRSTTDADGRSGPDGIGTTRASSGFVRSTFRCTEPSTIPGWGARRSAALWRCVVPSLRSAAAVRGAQPAEMAAQRDEKR